MSITPWFIIRKISFLIVFPFDYVHHTVIKIHKNKGYSSKIDGLSQRFSHEISSEEKSQVFWLKNFLSLQILLLGYFLEAIERRELMKRRRKKYKWNIKKTRKHCNY